MIINDPRQMELNSLLEVTQSINNNMPEDSLFKILYFSCLTHIRFQKIALLVLEEEKWQCKVGHGFSITDKLLTEAAELPEFKRPQILDPQYRHGAFHEVEAILTVRHKEKTLAIMIFGGLGEKEFNITELNFIQTITNVIMVAIENKRLARREMRRFEMRKEMEIAQNVQSLLFPDVLPNNDKIKMAASYLPHYHVSGDYYDYIDIEAEECIFCVADVSGKGVPAALLMSNFQACLRTLVRQTTSLNIMIRELNFLIHANSKGEKFITLFIGKYNKETRYLKYINAGHNPPYLQRSNGDLETLNDGTIVLGIMPKLPFMNQGGVKLEKDDLLFMFTDGVTETANDADEEFGEEGIEKVLKNHQWKDNNFLHEEIILAVDAFKQSQNYRDDLTLLSCKFG